MIVTFPRLGDLHIPFRAFLEALGMTTVVPPPTTKKTMDLGTRYSPELSCLPLKISLGNMLEGIDLGADTIIMLGGIGPCRLGYYCEMQREILRDLGSSATLVAIEPLSQGLRRFIGQIAFLVKRATPHQVIHAIRLFWAKARSLDAIEQEALKYRAYQAEPGLVSRVRARALQALEKAETIRDSLQVGMDGVTTIRACRAYGEMRPRIGLVGEIYVVWEPEANLNLAARLGDLGVEVVQPETVTGWIDANITRDMLRRRRDSEVLDLARPYLNHFVGGHGLESVARSCQMVDGGLDGVIHVAPLTCMPEIVAQSVLPRVMEDKGIPIMSMVFDEHTSDVGVQTRLEAFVDLIAQRKGGRLRSESISV